MNTCKTCKWWKTDTELGHLMPYGVRMCSNPKNGLNAPCVNDAMHPEADCCSCDARHEDGSGLLVPGPDFGCIHHEPAIPAADRPERV